MAGDWIKFEKATLDKPEVFEMADVLGIDPDAVIGKLLRVWNWFDDQSINGNAPVTVRPLLDRYAGVNGFASAMEGVEWLIVAGSEMCLPNFDRHNGQTAKTRALTAKRVSKSRSLSNGNCNDAGVTSTLPEKRREEKRREKYNTPSQEEFVAYLVDKLPGRNPDWTHDRATRAARARYETYAANGWRDGKDKPIKIWKTKALTAINYEKPWSYGSDEKPKQQSFAQINEQSKQATQARNLKGIC